jgi:DNA replication protein DnaC
VHQWGDVDLSKLINPDNPIEEGRVVLFNKQEDFMDDTVLLNKKMEKLRLSGMQLTLEQRLKTAQNERWSYSMLLDTLLTDEVERRSHTQLIKRLSKSMLNQEKTLETFDFSFNSKVHPATIRELACCKFISEFRNIFLIGPSGVGKNHLAHALGHEACRRGIDVLFYRTHKLFEWINSGRGDGSYKRKMDHIIKIPLLILDDLGLQSMPQAHQEDFYEIVCERYERRPLIITSNRDMSEWASIFTNPLIGSAAMDRLVHRANEIVIDGGSYRLDQFKKQAKRKAK